MPNNKKYDLSTAQIVGIIVGVLLVVWGVGVLWNTLGLLLTPQLPSAFVGIQSSLYSSHGGYSLLVVLGIAAYCFFKIKQGTMRNVFAKTAEPRRLTRSVLDKRMAGVCGGLAQWLGCGSASIRIIMLLLFTVSPGIVVIAYIALALVLPQE